MTYAIYNTIKTLITSRNGPHYMTLSCYLKKSTFMTLSWHNVLNQIALVLESQVYNYIQCDSAYSIAWS